MFRTARPSLLISRAIAAPATASIQSWQEQSQLRVKRLSLLVVLKYMMYKYVMSELNCLWCFPLQLFSRSQLHIICYIPSIIQADCIDLESWLSAYYMFMNQDLNQMWRSVQSSRAHPGNLHQPCLKDTIDALYLLQLITNHTKRNITMTNLCNNCFLWRTVNTYICYMCIT